jgi:hypothetical protein
MSAVTSIKEAIQAILDALETKGLPWVQEQLAALVEKFPDAGPLVSALLGLAGSVVQATVAGQAVPEAFADAVATLKAGSGPVDTAGGHTL